MSGVLQGLATANAVVSGVGSIARNTAAIVQTVGNLAGYLSGGALSGLGVWADGLMPASWRGVPFAVKSSQVRRGRRIAVHEFPFKDLVWVEDLGKGTRVVSFSGFLIGDDVYAQRDMMLAAAEVAGPGALVHPSLGTLNCSLTEFAAGERFDLGRVVEIEFSFIESGQDQPLFPTTDASTQADALDAADEMDSYSAADFGSDVATSVLVGADAINAATRTITAFTTSVAGVINDASRIAGAVNGIGAVVRGGTYFGRYDSGNLTAAPAVSIPSGLSTAERTSAAVLGLTTNMVNATRQVATLSLTANALAAAL